MKFLISFTSVIFLSINLQAQDLIVKTNGDEILGKVIKINPNDIVYKKKENPDGPEYSELKSNVLFVKYENGQKDIFTTANTPVVRDISTLCEPMKRKNAVFFELGGSGLYASINYERKIFNTKNKHFTALKAGLGPFVTLNILNATATYNIGDGMNFFEIGGGAGLYTNNLFANRSYYSDPIVYAYFTPIIGYRRESAKGFMFRSFITMYTNRQENYKSYYDANTGYYSSKPEVSYNYYPFLGLSFGYSF